MEDQSLQEIYQLLRSFLSQERYINDEYLKNHQTIKQFFTLLNVQEKFQVGFLNKINPKTLQYLIDEDVIDEASILALQSKEHLSGSWFYSCVGLSSAESIWWFVQQSINHNLEFDLDQLAFLILNKEGMAILNKAPINQLKLDLESMLYSTKIYPELLLRTYLQWWLQSKQSEQDLAFLMKRYSDWVNKEGVSSLIVTVVKMNVLLHYPNNLSESFIQIKAIWKQALIKCLHQREWDVQIILSFPSQLLLMVLQHINQSHALLDMLKPKLQDILWLKKSPRFAKLVRYHNLPFKLPPEPNLPESLASRLEDFKWV